MEENHKYNELIESLKLNKDIDRLADYTTSQIMGKCRTEYSQTVENILQVLDEKFGRTNQEKFNELLNKFIEFKTSDSDTGEDIIYKLESTITQIKDLKVAENFNYFLTLWMLRCVQKGNKLKDFEYKELQKVIKQVRLMCSRICLIC